MLNAETIFALSSGAPPAAVAIIRISGADALSAASALAGTLPPPRFAALRTLRDPDNGSVLDQALVISFPGPDNVTGEDLAELHVHGGRAVVRAVEAALEKMPELRRAEPGEFTRRAFINGRIDLNEAEGLADLLSAETEWQRRTATRMAGGAFSQKVEQWRGEILALSAGVEAMLDFSDEDDVPDEEILNITTRCVFLNDGMTALLSTPAAEKLRDGLRVVIAGPPNSGKSTLLNALVDREAAIVSDIAGTTRDLIEVPVAFEGVPFLLTDTAGLRDDSDDVIERIGIDRAERAVADADIVLWLGEEGDEPDHSRLFQIAAKRDAKDWVSPKTEAAIALSAKTGEGLARLIELLVETGQALLPPADGFAINQRQRAFIAEAGSALSRACAHNDMLVIAEELRLARMALDALTGRASTENMLDALFGRFCIGK